MRTIYVALLGLFFGFGGVIGIWVGYQTGKDDTMASFLKQTMRAESLQEKSTQIFYLGIAIGQDEDSGKITSGTVDSMCQDMPFDDCLTSLQVYQDAQGDGEAPKLHL
jgi:hypothetical protein